MLEQKNESEFFPSVKYNRGNMQNIPAVFNTDKLQKGQKKLQVYHKSCQYDNYISSLQDYSNKAWSSLDLLCCLCHGRMKIKHCQNNVRVWKTSQDFHFRFLNLHERRGILHLRTDHNNELLTLSRSIRSWLPFEKPVYMDSLYFVKTTSAETATHFTSGHKADR